MPVAMALPSRKEVPPKPTDWRRLALATVLRYATPAGQGKTKTQHPEPGPSEPISTNRLAPFYSAIRLPIPRHLQLGVNIP